MIIEVPDSFVPYVGFRAWLARATEQGWRLESVMRNTLWPIRMELVAECANGRGKDKHPSPPVTAGRCACGIYASDTARAMATYALPNYNYPWMGAMSLKLSLAIPARVVGFVKLWGRTVECLSGARGEKAYPESLWVFVKDARGQENQYEEIATDLLAYGVPVDLLPGGHVRDESILAMERLVHARFPNQGQEGGEAAAT